MHLQSPLIAFIDNSVHQIYKSLDALKENFPNIKVFNDEKEGLGFISVNEVAVVFMNLDLEHQDAVTLTKEIRKMKESQTFIIIYSGKQDDFVQELVLNAGADSFINFHNKPAILQLFLKNLTRRKKTHVLPVHKSYMTVDVEKYLIFKGDQPFQLPKKEFKVFELLYNHPEKFFNKKEIALRIWEDEKIALKRIIDVHIYNIRKLLGKRVIISQKGQGYRINKRLIESI